MVTHMISIPNGSNGHQKIECPFINISIILYYYIINQVLPNSSYHFSYLFNNLLYVLLTFFVAVSRS